MYNVYLSLVRTAKKKALTDENLPSHEEKFNSDILVLYTFVPYRTQVLAWNAFSRPNPGRSGSCKFLPN
jgi:hypothetical protein